MAHTLIPSLPPPSVDDGAAPHPVPVLPVPLPLHRHDRLRLHDRGHRARALHRSPLPHQLQPGHDAGQRVEQKSVQICHHRHSPIGPFLRQQVL